MDRHGRAAGQPRVLEIADHGLMLAPKRTFQDALIVREMRPDERDGAVEADLLHGVDAVISVAAPELDEALRHVADAQDVGDDHRAVRGSRDRREIVDQGGEAELLDALEQRVEAAVHVAGGVELSREAVDEIMHRAITPVPTLGG